jgi:two-component system OmpR family response regulator
MPEISHKGSMNTAETIVIVEDDADIRGMVAELLTAEGWRVKEASGAPELAVCLDAGDVALVILDINLPGEDGLSICRRLSVSSSIAILMLTARSDDVDKIIGLEVGADDYLGKPFNPRELVARVRALLRRSGRNGAVNEDAAELVIGPLRIDRASRRVFRSGGDDIPLSGAEFDLLVTLAEAAGRVLSRDHLLDRIHGRSHHAFDRSIDMLVSRLRKKIDVDGEPSMIEAVRNAGYVLRRPRVS